jgi:predicted ATP-grasp superfamily ATP-dependent carboligase
MPTVLVTDCWTNKALSVVRSLGLAGLEVHAAAHKRNGAALYSRFVAKRFILPTPEELLGLVRGGRYACVMPLEEETVRLLQADRDIPPGLVALPPIESLRIASDKLATWRLAVEVGVPVPRSAQGVAEALAELTFPMIVKPLHSSGSRGVVRVTNEAQLIARESEIATRFGPTFIQEALPASGAGLGVGLIADRGHVLNAYAYRRLREFPVSGGPSTLRETVESPELIRHAEPLMQALDWTGVAMVEFKTDVRDGVARLLEINPRFWGSLELAAVAGMNFPWMLYKLTKGEPVERVAARAGVRCRWLLPGDLAHFLANPRRFSLDPSFFRFFDADTHYDDFKAYDVRGSVATVPCAFLSLFDPETWKLGVFRR